MAIETTPAVDASTIVLARDGQEGLEVFLLERHLRSDFAGGAFVFPGGKVDPHDRELPQERWRGIDVATAAELVGAVTEDVALGLYVAAVRETFEEAGVLLASRRGIPLTGADLDAPAVAEARHRLNDRDDPWDWIGWLEEQDLVLDLGALGFFSWWVTPDGMHRRYDTRFFVARVPEDQSRHLSADEVETTGGRWVTPAAALEAAARGEVTIIYPTRRNLAAIGEHATAADLVAAARAGHVDQRRIQPRLEMHEDGTATVFHPYDGTSDTM